MSQPRLVARMARRELVARPWRTLLVAFLIAIPVTAMTVFAVGLRTVPSDPAGPARYGQADVVVRDTWVEGTELADPQPVNKAHLPPGSRSAFVVETAIRLVSQSGKRSFPTVRVGALTDPVLRGYTTLLSGRLPRSVGEVALSPKAQHQLGVGIGDILRLRKPVATLRVVGTVVKPDAYNDAFVVAHDALKGHAFFVNGLSFVDLPPGAPSDRQSLLPLEKGYNEQIAGTANGVSFGGAPQLDVRAEEIKANKDEGRVALNWSYVAGALLLLVVGLIVAAAFSVGAQRQLRTLGILGSNGAKETLLRRTLIVQGLFSGVAGVALGGVLSAALLLAFGGRRDRMVNRVTSGWILHPADLIPIAVLGVAAAVIAAMQPARSAGRLSVLEALAGQSRNRAVPRWTVPLGITAFFAGLGLLAVSILGAAGGANSGTTWTLTAILGGVAILIGATACAPSIVQHLDPLATRLRGTVRMGVRGVVRQRARSAAVIAAVAAAASLAVASSATALSSTKRDHQSQHQLPANTVLLQSATFDGEPGASVNPSLDKELVAEVDRIVHPSHRVSYSLVDGFVEVYPTSTPGSRVGGNGMPTAAVGSPELVHFLGGTDRDAVSLASGKAIVFGPATLGSTASIHISKVTNIAEPVVVSSGFGDKVTTNRAEISDTVKVSAIVRTPRLTADGLPSILLPSSMVSRLDPALIGEGLILQAPKALTATQRDALDNAQADAFDAAGGPGNLILKPLPSVQWFHPQSSLATRLQAILAGIAVLFTLAVVAVALALEGAESRGERDVLVAVGAPPRSVASLVAMKGATLAAVAMVLALPMGLAPFAVFARVSTPHHPFVIPYLVIGLLVFVAPAIVWLAAFGTSSLAARISPVTATRLSAD
jgi:putative ABC transport system permease protein